MNWISNFKEPSPVAFGSKQQFDHDNVTSFPCCESNITSQYTKLRQFSAGEIPLIDVIITSIRLSKAFIHPHNTSELTNPIFRSL